MKKMDFANMKLLEMAKVALRFRYGALRFTYGATTPPLYAHEVLHDHLETQTYV